MRVVAVVFLVWLLWRIGDRIGVALWDPLSTRLRARGKPSRPSTPMTADARCPTCDETTSTGRFDGSCDGCLHFRSPLSEVDWYDGPVLFCAECVADWDPITARYRTAETDGVRCWNAPGTGSTDGADQ